MTRTPARRNDFAEFVLEQIAPVGKARSRAMFGGHGIYLDEHFVAIILDDRLYLKADAATRGAFEAEKLAPMTFSMKGKEVTAQYFEAPAAVFEDPDAMRKWILLARAAAARSRQAKARPRGRSR